MHNLRNFALWILVGLSAVMLFNLFQGSSSRTSPPPLSYSQFRQEVLQDDVRRITIQGDQVMGVLANGSAFTTTVPNNDQSLWTILKEHNVNVTIAPPDDGMPTLLAVLLNWFPMLLLIGVLVLFLRRVRPGAAGSDVQGRKVNWRRGLLRTWVVGSILWLGIWASMIWNACRMEYVCWLSLFVPSLPSSSGAAAGHFEIWAWAAVIGEGLAVPAIVFGLGYAVMWALEGFRHTN